MNRLLKWFDHEHLPADLRLVVQPIKELAEQMDRTLNESAEKTVGLRKLMEAKDCLVRARIEDRAQCQAHDHHYPRSMDRADDATPSEDAVARAGRNG